MRIIITWICLVVIGLGNLLGQCERGEYTIIIKLAKADLEARNYQLCIERLLDARDICPDEKNMINALIKQAFDEVESLARELTLTVISNQDLLLEKVQEEIYELKFEEAEKIVRGLGKVNVGKENVLRQYGELIFFYTEAEKVGKAWSFFKQAKPLAETTPTFQGSDTLAYLRDVLTNWLPADILDQIHYRYYPKMVFVEGGRFAYQKDAINIKTLKFDLPGIDTTVNSFHIGQTEITIWQYYLYTVAIDSAMARKPSWGYSGDNPVIFVSWYDVNKYAKWLSQKMGENYELPDEVDWEFAARGGNKSNGYKYSGSNKVDSVGWYRGNAESRTHPVATKNPNELGLYDMSGNVYEWCQNTSASGRVARGGNQSDYAEKCMVANRKDKGSAYRDFSIGFRLVRR